MVDIDVGKISESLNNKADRDLNNTQPLARTVVEVSDKSLMPSWYRVYSDGWCEQGGYDETTYTDSHTYSLLKNYIDTKYIINVTCLANTSIGSVPFIHKPSKTESSFKYQLSSSGGAYGGVSWQASGYIGTSTNSSGSSTNGSSGGSIFG